nr:hypothetical protein [Clostridium botulinum]
MLSCGEKCACDILEHFDFTHLIYLNYTFIT